MIRKSFEDRASLAAFGTIRLALLVLAGIAIAPALAILDGSSAEAAHRCASQADGSDEHRPDAGRPDGAPRDSRRRELDERRQRWRDLPREDREYYLNLHRVLRDLPEDKREALKQRLSNLRPEEKEHLREMLRRFQSKPRPEREELRRRYQTLHRWESYLPGADRERLRNMDPDARKQAMRERFSKLVQEYLGTLTPEERQAYQTLPRPERRERLHAYLGERHPPHPHRGGPGPRRHRSPELEERLRQERAMLSELRERLRAVPPAERPRLLDPEDTGDPVLDQLRRELEQLSPRQRGWLRRSLEDRPGPNGDRVGPPGDRGGPPGRSGPDRWRPRGERSETRARGVEPKRRPGSDSDHT